MLKIIINAINSLFSLFYILILLRCVFSFIPSLDCRKQPYSFILDITEPFLELFRRFIPPIGMVDVSPIVAILVLSLIQNVLYQLLSI